MRVVLLEGRKFREHAGYHEVEPPVRSAPFGGTQPFVPGESNANHQGQLTCSRGAADIPKEIAERQVSDSLAADEAARLVLVGRRVCPYWTRYVVGLDPNRHYVELRVRALEEDRKQFELKLVRMETRQGERERRRDRRLMWISILVAGIVGVLAMTKDSIVLEQLTATCEWALTRLGIMSAEKPDVSSGREGGRR
jgi:hypothetical protein